MIWFVSKKQYKKDMLKLNKIIKRLYAPGIYTLINKNKKEIKKLWAALEGKQMITVEKVFDSTHGSLEWRVICGHCNWSWNTWSDKEETTHNCQEDQSE